MADQGENLEKPIPEVSRAHRIRASLVASLGLVTGTLKFARAYSDVDLNRTEQQLEEEIRRESCVPPPDYKVARLRHSGVQVLHSKHVLLAVVILNLVDCALVLGELVLDINYIKELRENSELSSRSFINAMEERYPDVLHDHSIDNIEPLYQKIYNADCFWNRSQTPTTNPLPAGADGFHPSQHFTAAENISARTGPEYSVHGSSNRTRRKRSDSDTTHARTYPDMHQKILHSIWVEIAHGMHKASITILGILFIENILKMMFMGRSFFSKRLEVFDAVIVILSFIIDLVFLKGLTGYRIQDALLILSFLLPWRVIRVVNSLIVAVLDQEHFRLKMLYQEKKVIAAELKVLREKDKKWDFHLQKIEKFCESEGIPKWKIRQHTAMGRKQSTITSMASLALNGLLTGMMTSPEDNHLFARSMSHMKGKSKSASDLDSIDESDDESDDDVTTLNSQSADLKTEVTSSENNNNSAICRHNHVQAPTRMNKRVSFDDVERKPLIRQHSLDESFKDRTISEESEVSMQRSDSIV